jgi:hypothetical protein
MKTIVARTLCVFALMTLAPFTQAASIVYVGQQNDYETVSNDATTGWRNASTVKPLDIDGDNIFGTDGYEFGGGSTPKSLPSYVNDFNINGNHNDNGRGFLDNPADPGGADIRGGWAGRSGGGNFATIVFNQAMSDTVRLGVIYDNDWNVSTGTQTFTLTQTVGGSSSVTTPTLTLEGSGSASYDILFFDLVGIQSGDSFTLDVTKGTVSWGQITGMTFDSVPEPSSLSLLLLGSGALYLLRRRTH